MIDIVFVKPNNKKLYGSLSESISGIEPPLWAALLASIVRNKGYSVSIIDAEVQNLDASETVVEINKHSPLLVAISVCGSNPSASTPTMTAAREILNKLDGVETILIGLHPTALPERTMEEERVSYVCEGEGIETIPRLLSIMKKWPCDFSLVPGLWYREDGKILHNSKANPTENLDLLPMPAWNLLPMIQYRAHNWQCWGQENRSYAVIYTSLGCPFSCKFCCTNALFGKRGIRYRSPQNVIEEIDFLVTSYAIKNFKIMDEMFFLSKKHVEDLCDLLIERNYDLNIWAYARVDTTDRNLLKKVKAAGINQLGLGIESSSDRVLNDITKGKFGKKQIKEIVDIIHDHGISVGGNYIFGLPEDNLESMQETLDFAKELNCEFANFYCAMAYPGSELYNETPKERLPDSWEGYSQYSYRTFPLATRYISNVDVLKFRDKAFSEYYTNEKYLKMMFEKFGPKAVEQVKRMCKKELKRELFETPNADVLGQR